MAVTGADYESVGSSVKAGTIEYSGSTTFVIDTGLSEVNYFAFVGTLKDYGDAFESTLAYRKLTNGWTQSSIQSSASNGTVFQSIGGNGVLSQQNYAPVITNISGGVITIQGGSAGTHGQLVGKWYAE